MASQGSVETVIDSSQGSQTIAPPTLPVLSGKKRPKLETPTPSGTRDVIKWVGKVPFVQSCRTGKIHCGNSTMLKEEVNGVTIITCCTDCCIMAGQAYGGLCSCFCHVLAKDYSSRS